MVMITELDRRRAQVIFAAWCLKHKKELNKLQKEIKVKDKKRKDLDVAVHKLKASATTKRLIYRDLLTGLRTRIAH